MSHFLKEAAKIRKKPYVKAGITQAQGSKLRADGRLTTAEIGQIHEYGAPGRGIPERSFIRSTLNSNQSKYDSHIAKLRDEIFDANSGMTTERALGLIGQEFASDVKTTIRAGISPALKESTVRRKNAGVIEKAKGTIAGVNAAGAKGKLTKAQVMKGAQANETITTGGASTPLIDKGQLIGSISYEVVSDGSSENGTEGGSH